MIESTDHSITFKPWLFVKGMIHSRGGTIWEDGFFFLRLSLH